MKANEVPEKLYFNQHTAQYNHERRNDDDIEYTSTDAFVKKALSYLCNKFYFNNVFYGIVSTDFNAMEEMYDDFRKYMEGERYEMSELWW